MPVSTIRTISPSTNKVVCEVPETSLADARSIAKASEEAFLKWRLSSLETRRVVIERALAIIQERKMDLGRELSEQMGRPVAYSHKEIETMQKRADYLLETAADSLADIPGREEAGFKRTVKKAPVGPVLVCFAWNVRRGHLVLDTHRSRPRVC